jgi:hypothetical protein
VYETVILAEFEEIRVQLKPNEDNVHSYLEFVERTWIGCHLGQATKKPLFPITVWITTTASLQVIMEIKFKMSLGGRGWL